MHELLIPHLADDISEVVIVVDPAGQINFASDRTEQMFGHRPEELVGKELRMLMLDQAADAHEVSWNASREETRPPAKEGSAAMAMRKDGTAFPIQSKLMPVRTPDGVFVVAAISDSRAESLHGKTIEADNVRLRRLLAKAGVDALESTAAKAVQRLILEELHHRLKNTLATVIAITSQTLRNADTLEEGKIALEGRLHALSKAQDLLLQARVVGAKLDQTICSAVEPFETPSARRFAVRTASIDIGPGAVLPLLMMLNELCTNAAKHGALTVEAGRVAITSSLDEKAQRLHLTWAESGGPPVAGPRRQSFGTRLIHRLADQLHGGVSLSFEPAGFIFEFEASLPVLQTIPAN